MRSPRQNKIDVAVAEALNLAAGYLVPLSVLKADAGRLVVPRATDTELTAAVAYHDQGGRLTSVQGETEPKYKLNAAGQAWHAENA